MLTQNLGHIKALSGINSSTFLSYVFFPVYKNGQKIFFKIKIVY